MKPIFTGNDDFNKSAFLNWRISKQQDIQNLLTMAGCFLNSSIVLAKIALTDNKDKKADCLIFPILTNANHGIELYLKALVWTLNALLNSEYKVEGSHNIQQILETAKSKIEQYKDKESLNSFNNHIENLQKYIDELFAKIQATPQKDKMDFTRYPFDKKYDNYFYVDEIENVEIDLENFVLRFENILKELDGVVSHYYYHELLKEGKQNIS